MPAVARMNFDEMNNFPSPKLDSHLPPTLPPPTAPLPALPLEATAQAPPSTPCNASHLYGEFSWPSLDVATLVLKLEDIAECKEDELPSFHALGKADPEDAAFLGGCSFAIGDCLCDEDHPPEDLLFEEICFSEKRSPLQDVYAYPFTSNSTTGGIVCGSESGSVYHTCSEGEQSDLRVSDRDESNNEDESDFLNSKDWTELLKMLGWLGDFDGDAQEQLLDLNSRGRDERRWGAFIDEDHDE
ncbi:MAG: hypothetical protein Q9225_006856 [Loekoesia sp. 1 TL-2023]